MALACAAFLALAGRTEAAAIEQLDARVAGVSVRAPRAPVGSPLRLLANAPPLFPVLSGEGAASEVALHLEGVARSPTRMAALVAINGAPAAWLAVGETRDGVTLQEVTATGVTVETLLGPRTVSLGQTGTPPEASAAPDTPPPGVRGPPEPASAPAVKP